MKSLFEYSSYSKYLRDLTGDAAGNMTVSKLAQVAEVQRPYMSNVIAQRSQLSLEQGYRVAKFFNFDEREQSYFLNMIEIERASSSEYKTHLQKKNEALRKEANKLENKLERTAARLDPQITAEYFSSWEFVTIHVLVSIKEFQTLDKITQALKLDPSYAASCLNKLAEWGLVKKSGDQFQWASGDIHLPGNSPITVLHHRNLRDKALEHAKVQPEQGVHFTSAYSMSTNDYEKIKNSILSFLKQYNQDAAQSKEEKLVCLNIDFFGMT